MVKRVVVAVCTVSLVFRPRVIARVTAGRRVVLATVVSVVVGFAGVSVSAASAAPPVPQAGASHGNGNPLTPRLRHLADPGFAALTPRVRARRLGLPASGPGSIIERPGGRVLVDVRMSDTGFATLQRLRASGAHLM